MRRPASNVFVTLVIVAMIAAVLPAVALGEASGATSAPVSPARSPLDKSDPVDLVDLAAAPGEAINGGVFSLQFSSPLSMIDHGFLAESGVTIGQAIPPSTYIARLAPDAAALLQGYPGFLGLERRLSADKLSPALRNDNVPAHALSPTGEVKGTATFFSDVRLDEALAAADSAALTLSDRTRFLVGNRLSFQGSSTAVATLASDPRVLTISEAPAPPAADNATAQVVNGSVALQTLGHNGSNVTLGMWDGGPIRSTHQDLTGRVTNNEPGPVNDHATHVAGTLIGSGSGNIFAEGMAPSATVQGYDFADDVATELTDAISSDGIVASNHSWGGCAGRGPGGSNTCALWTSEATFGSYGGRSVAWDNVVRDTDHIIVKSAGNDSGQCGFQAADTDNCDGFLAGDGRYYDNIPDHGVAKNVITVGAIDYVPNTIASFSSVGPADDGRIKPDVVAYGVGLVSTGSSSDSAYRPESGTSMSAPVVTGILAQLVPVYRSSHDGAEMPADTAKALLVNTATDLGRPGPDYVYGYGSVDAVLAFREIDSGVHDQNDSVVNHEIDTYEVDVTFGTPYLSVTLNWIDPAGALGPGADMVNDLDLTLISPSGTFHYPFSGPGRSNPAGLATTSGPNSVDTVEQVRLLVPEVGTWTVAVDGTNVTDVQDGPQRYALVSSNELVTNDDASVANVIGGPSATASGDNVRYTSGGLELDPSCNVAAAGNSAWWTWRATTDGEITIDTAGSDFDTVLAVYRSVFDEVACNDDAYSGAVHSSVKLQAEADVTYYLRVDGSSSASPSGNIILRTLNNDTFDGARSIAGPDDTKTGRNIGYYIEPGEPTPTCSSTPNVNSAWWNWTAPTTGVVTIDTIGSSFDTVLAVYSGNAVDALTEVACDDEGGAGTTSRLNLAATAGTTYRIQVFGWDGTFGDIVLNTTAACSTGNNDFVCAETAVLNSPFGGSNVGYGPETNEPNATCDGGSGTGPSAWWRWTAPNNQVVKIDTINSDFDTVLAVYTGETLASLVEVACNDNYGPGLNQSFLEFRPEVGTDYYIQVDGWTGATGLINLWLTGCGEFNDDFGCEHEIGGPTDTQTSSNAGYGGQVDEPWALCGTFPFIRRSAWWRWEAPNNDSVTIDTFGSDFGTVLAVYTGSSLDSLTQVACNKDAPAREQSQVTFQPTSGEAYYIQVDGLFDFDVGDIVLNTRSAPCASNDAYGLPESLGTVGTTQVTTTGDTSCASGEIGEIADGAVETLWYSFVAEATGSATVSTCAAADFDTVLSVYKNSFGHLSTLELLKKENDPSGVGEDRCAAGTDRAQLTLPVVAGETYRIQVDGVGDASGTFTLSVQQHFCGSAAATQVGSAGNDIFNQLPDGAVVAALSGSDNVVADSGASITACGGAGNDDLRGSSGDDVLSGGAGDDNIRGFGGNDMVLGDAESGAPAAEAATDGDDTLRGGNGRDTVYGNGGNDTGIAGGGSDFVDGGTGVDGLNGGAGPDEIHGGDGDDVVRGQGDVDTQYGDDGDDIMRGHAGDDVMRGAGGEDTLLGSSGDDTLFGGPNNDTLWAGTGADSLDGGTGSNDFCHGGSDNDPDTDIRCEVRNLLP